MLPHGVGIGRRQPPREERLLRCARRREERFSGLVRSKPRSLRDVETRRCAAKRGKSCCLQWTNTRGVQMSEQKEPVKPVSDPEFWKGRLKRAAAGPHGIHQAIYIIDRTEWVKIQKATRILLKKYLQPGDKFLDAGCGYGETIDCLPCDVEYAGVDCSPDLIKLAQSKHEGSDFRVADLCDLPFPDQSFRWSFCRSVRGMIIDNLGVDRWYIMEKELLRVSRSLILTEYGDLRQNVEVDAVVLEQPADRSDE